MPRTHNRRPVNPVPPMSNFALADLFLAVGCWNSKRLIGLAKAFQGVPASHPLLFVEENDPHAPIGEPLTSDEPCPSRGRGYLY